jgi:hypothetical protein
MAGVLMFLSGRTWFVPGQLAATEAERHRRTTAVDEAILS